MPNSSNIDSPFILISYGRSGTSLLHNAFFTHPECDAVGETANLIGNVWHATELSKEIIRGNIINGYSWSDNDRCAHAVRSVFLSMFPSEKKFWMQKPINLPSCETNLKMQGMSLSDIYGWYWNAISRSFPACKCFTVLRHPYDVVLSAQSYWKTKPEMAFEALDQMADLILHERSRIDYAVNYSRLIDAPEDELKRLCQFLNFPFHANMLEATNTIYVPAAGSAKIPSGASVGKKTTNFSHRERWSQIPKTNRSKAAMKKVRALWENFGIKLTF